MVYLFDIDGTLNEAQQPISKEMRQRLESLARVAQVYFITGNGYTKSMDILNGHVAMFSGVFIHGGDELRTMRGKLIWKDAVSAKLPVQIERTLIGCGGLRKNPKLNCIEFRGYSMLNYSLLGRYATKEERAAHDNTWRPVFADFIRNRFPGVEVYLGGQVSLDICAAGANKSRACKWLNDNGKTFTFIGDKTCEGGNDSPVAEYCADHPENLCFTTTGCLNTIGIIDSILKDA